MRLDFLESLFFHWFSMPVVHIFLFWHVFSLESLGNDQGWDTFCSFCFVKGFCDCSNIMAINNNSIPALCLNAFSVSLHFVAQSSSFRLTKTVAIDDCAKIVKFVMSRILHGFPNTSFGTFTISHHTEYSVRSLINIFGNPSHTSSIGQSLTQ
jgi:hypothetical protein